jgi:hypothetical protein
MMMMKSMITFVCQFLKLWIIINVSPPPSVID